MIESVSDEHPEALDVVQLRVLWDQIQGGILLPRLGTAGLIEDAQGERGEEGKEDVEESTDAVFGLFVKFDCIQKHLFVERCIQSSV